MNPVLFWDIDGTLLTTGRAGIFAWEDAALQLLGKKIDLSTLRTAGLPDYEIAVKILEAAYTAPSPDLVTSLLRLYETYLPSSLPRKSGNVLHGVREILNHLRNQPDILSILLTGNTRTGAMTKLAYYGLDAYFAVGAFSDVGMDRPTIAQKALDLARGIRQGLSLDQIYVIGDTPHDIHCGKVIGARVIAVATGSYSLTELLCHDPWWAIEKLPEPEIFIKKIFSS
ncbi:MAG: HAD hydrolase-like protein [Candidatus Manganitrophaceae bacterium]